jgi:hypothetical protein
LSCYASPVFGFAGPLGRGPFTYFTYFAEVYAGRRLSNIADS